MNITDRCSLLGVTALVLTLGVIPPAQAQGDATTPATGDATTTKPAETTPSDKAPKPAETKPADAKPADAKTADDTDDDDASGPKLRAPQLGQPRTTGPRLTTGDPADTTTPAETKPAETKPAETKPAETKPAETKPAPVKKGKDDEDDTEPFGDGKKSPISDLATSDKDFVPLEDIKEETLDPVFATVAYPFVTWGGQMRFRIRSLNNFSLGTKGTSAILPPLESYTPSGKPADADARSMWSSDMLLRLEPTFTIIEGLNVHVEADLLGNVVLGSAPINALDVNPLYPDPSRNAMGSGQYSAREREWFGNAVRINEAYGEVDSFFGVLRLGRMDNHWGLGMFANNGDCLDCNWGDHIDRAMLRSKVSLLPVPFYFRATYDFPGNGPTSVNANTPQGQPYDLGQLDDVNQWSLAVSYEPHTDHERELQRKRLEEDRAPVINGGLWFIRRRQQGMTLSPGYGQAAGATDTSTLSLIYREQKSYLLDGWAELRYHPDPKTKMRFGLEAATIFGSVQNATTQQVGQQTAGDEGATAVNCFNETERQGNSDVCSANSKTFGQFALALESEFQLDSPVAFGLNAGYASGGSAPNWGYSRSGYGTQSDPAPDLDFFRFDPDYHVDLILFRNVIGTVTNAYYLKPYMQASFLESGERKVRLDLSAILSRAANEEGTPGAAPWLGLEFDGAARYIIKDRFHAALMAGVLFPFEGLNAVQNRPRLTEFGTNTGTFSESVDATTAWTLQLRVNWQF